MSIKIVEINGGVFGSTGRIMFGIADALEDKGHEALCFSPVTDTNRYREPDHPYVKIGSFRTRQLNVLCEMVTGLHGSFARLATKRLLRRIDAFAPDLIHLHNIHGSYINLPMLFGYIRDRGLPVVWTLHDCWAFTGGCPYFDITGCDKWKTGCFGCPVYKEYPVSFYDNAKAMYRKKKRLFSGIDRMTLITPSRWLKAHADSSFLRQYPVRVINNGIDLSGFRPTKSDFKKRYGCEDSFILLGVAFGWGKRKGLDVFLRLAEELPGDFRIVLVGTDDSVDTQLPGNIISIHRTQDVNELVQIYSAADLFVNPTREDNFPTVNIEALACGTPVLTFDTGGSAEIIDDTCGFAVAKDDTGAMLSQIKRIADERPFTQEACVKRAALYDEKSRFAEYVSLYEEMLYE